MSRNIFPAWLTLAFIFAASIVRSQDFSYTLSASTGAYQDLSAPVMLSNNDDWTHKRFKLAIGFSFNFNGASYDSLSVEPGGIIKFSSDNAITIFYGSNCKLDSTGYYSSLSYKLSGVPGSRVLKIQYDNCGYDRNDAAESLDYQLWLYEQDNKIELHTGANTYPASAGQADILITPLAGLINPMKDSNVSALLLTGTTSSPSIQSIGEADPLVYMDFIPPANKVYSFTPTGN